MSANNQSSAPSVIASVVVATYRRPEFVRECLTRLQAQSLRPQRIIVVDASPETDTRDVVRGFANVDYRRNERGAGTLSTSRAIGIKDLTDDVVAFIDDDAYAEPQWLEELLKPYADPSVGAVGGRALNGREGEAAEGIGEIGLLLPDGRLTGNFAADPGRDLDVDHMLGANMSVRLNAIRALGGIRELYPGTCLREDADIALRIGKSGLRVVYAPKAVVHHVAGDYAKGKRFDSRYHYYGARNHVVLLATTLGWRDIHLRRYVLTVGRQTLREVRGGVRALRDRERAGIGAKLRGLAGGLRRAAILVVGTIAGGVAAVAARPTIVRRG
ncbi:glycosyltransferase family 2 protein [Microbacterium lacus]|uniref:glycosyltransferase family 2 protein n=1 Tax=Microbacterium lacus TaxID=415217 RepID=UPI00385033CA